MDIKAMSKILHNGEEYKPGETVTGLTQAEYDRLIRLKDGEVLEAVVTNVGDDGGDYTGGDQLPSLGLILSVDDFAELKADDQKAHLKALEIDPAGKEEDRVAQYEDWYAEQVTANDQD